jgi:hypothetical protein
MPSPALLHRRGDAAAQLAGSADVVDDPARQRNWTPAYLR